MGEGYVSVRTVAGILDKSVDAVRAMEKRKELERAPGGGRTVLITKASVRAWLEKKRGLSEMEEARREKLAERNRFNAALRA